MSIDGGSQNRMFMLRIRFYRYYAPEWIVLELAVLLVSFCVSKILSVYYRRKYKKGPTWRCTCSRVVPENEYVCVCGRTKLSLLTDKTGQSPVPPPNLPGWVCTCGRKNPPYQSSCVCGTSKRETTTDPPKS